MKVAEQLFQACSADVCPREIRRECLTFLDGIRDIVPTLVFVATDENGRDIVDAQVFSGEEKLVDRLDGRAVPVDPGKHTFRFVLSTGEVLTTEVLVREGDKSRQVRVAMEPKAQLNADVPVAPATTVGPVAPSPAAPIVKNYTPAWIVTGIAAASLASFGTFALMGKSEQSGLDKCAPNCSAGSDDTMRTFYAVADVSLLVGVLSAGVATYLFLKPPTVAGVSTNVGVQLQNSNLGLVVGGRF